MFLSSDRLKCSVRNTRRRLRTFDDTSNVTAFDIKQKARRLKLKYGLDIILIDYLQMISGPKGVSVENRNVIITEISKALKGLAKELSIPVIALSQLSRSVERREDKRPMLSDLRESGSIEQDADLVAFLYRDDYYNRGKTPTDGEGEQVETGTTELIIRKHRNGSVGTLKFKFLPEYSLFDEIPDSLSD